MFLWQKEEKVSGILQEQMEALRVKAPSYKTL